MNLDYDSLNPGIRLTVRWLRALGFETLDSGDGQTHEHGCDREGPYVVMRVAAEKLLEQADRLVQAVRDKGIVLTSINPWGVPAVQASYDPVSGTAYLDLMDVDDDLLQGKRPVVPRESPEFGLPPAGPDL